MLFNPSFFTFSYIELTLFMKQLVTLFALSICLTGCKNENRENDSEFQKGTVGEAAERVERERDSIEINPVSHATAVIRWDETVFYTDPTGGAEAFNGMEDPDFILISDIHGDHMHAETLKALNLGNTQIIVPQAVKDALPEDFHGQLIVMNNGDKREFMGFNIEAIPMYNLPESPDSRHVKGRGNGYVLEKDGQRLYIAGDTEAIPEMKNLSNIDIALIPMNQTYTMGVEQAAEGVLAFKPKTVYPYHYRNPDGLADVEKFRKLVNEGDDEIEVVLLNWYPNRNN